MSAAIEKVTLSRRRFLASGAVTGAGLVLGFYLPAGRPHFADTPAGAFAPNAWLQIDPQGQVTVWLARSEMGQGVMTALPMIVAEELEADWSKVRVELALADRERYGPQGTGGSASVRTSFEPLRRAGAAGRAMLIAAAAKTWNVDPESCRAETGTVIHESGMRLTYGDLAAKASKLEVPEEIQLKDPSEFRLLGKPMPRLDSLPKVTGAATFGMDVRVPGMLYAVVARSDVFGGKALSHDGAKAKAVKGVRHVVPIETGIAVVADDTWTALQGRDALEVKWDGGPNADLSTERISRMWDEAAKGKGAVAREDGDPDAALSSASRRVDAVLEVPYLAHAPLEPMNCTADVRKDSCEVWAPTQFPGLVRDEVVRVTGLPREAVKVHVTLMGGGFGRRIDPDYGAEAAAISKAVGAPVQIVFTREDDMRHDYYRPGSRHVLSAALDGEGRLTAWTHHMIAASIGAQRGYVQGKMDEGAMRGASNLPYAVPNIRVDYSMVNTSVPTGWWRSVYDNQNAFANECFMDEVAEAAGKDPYELRRELLAGAPRHRGVLDLAAEKAGWGKALPEGRGRGIAVHYCFQSWAAMVAEVTVGRDGAVRVDRVVAAVDCGMVVNPLSIEAQVEGGIVYALTAALKGAITVEKGRVQQGNFDDYPLLLMSEMPEVEVHIVPSKEAPTGIGEPPVPPTAPAVANAIFAATGKRVRRLPIRAEELRRA
jgi:CO/xanthine dehydrogenase Mo-binding subunit